jgi:hypothetical protein
MKSIDPVIVFVIRDEVLTITTAEAAEEVVVERVYDVSALLDNGETAQDLAASLNQTFHRRQVSPNEAEKPVVDPPKQDPPQAQPARKPVPADAEWHGPLIAARRKALLVRGTETEHESVLRLLRGLKQLAAAEKAKGSP